MLIKALNILNRYVQNEALQKEAKDNMRQAVKMLQEKKKDIHTWAKNVKFKITKNKSNKNNVNMKTT